MFSRKSTAERTAAQAWDYLSAAVSSAGEDARSQGSHLAGKPPRLPWGLIVCAGALGAALGWAAAATARAVITRRVENDQLEMAETPLTPLPTFEN